MKLAEKLSSICQNNKKDEALRETDSWQVLYHLSPMRENLLEWYPFREDASLLEIGSEAGAMTGLFANRVNCVVCLEQDSKLADVNKLRNQESGNIDFRVGNISEIQPEEKFDYITLIGVLGKAADYIVSENPYLNLLKQCKAHLKDGGVLILAADNKSGMKYWAGAPESETGRVFAGIQNDFHEKENRSFTKKELEQMLTASGFTQREFRYPVPDYRFVSCVYSDEFLPQRGELRPGNGVYEPDGYQFFLEDLAYDMVCEDGQYSYFADSFLIVAGIDSEKM